VQRIVEDGNRAAEVIGRIRRLMAKTAPRMTQVQINDVIRETLDFMRGELQKQHVVVRTALADALPSVPGDPIQLQQVLVNLILNGAEAMASVPEPARRLDVRSDRHEPDGIIVAVRDQGAGLTAEMADRMFEAFFSTKPSGLGMGLSISRSIIEAHGGRLWATPDGGRGATLQFTIPGDPPRA
jgi:C4-dicarboxylate-specific signal transduction histidine kinase